MLDAFCLTTGYSRKYGRMIAMGYARAEIPLSDEMILGATYEVNIAGEIFAVTAHLRPV